MITGPPSGPGVHPQNRLQQSEMGRGVYALRAHTTPRVSAVEILTTDLGLLQLT